MKMIKNLILLSAVAASTIAFAAQPGAFVGATVGYSMAHLSPDIDGVKKNGFAYGIQGGYNFSKNYGIELAYNKPRSLKYQGETALKLYDIDVLADGYLPVASNIDIVGKAGFAYVHGSVADDNATSSKTKPKLAFGVNYALQQNMSLQATYSRIFDLKDSGLATGKVNLDMLSLSFNYSFGSGNSDMM